MAFNDLERKKIENALAAFLERSRPPAHIRATLDYTARIADQSVELFEVRPQWDAPSMQQERPFAKATFIRSRNAWKIYWQRADLKWHGYEPHPVAATVEEFLAVVSADEHCCFYG